MVSLRVSRPLVDRARTTKFARFLLARTPETIAAETGVTKFSVYGWITRGNMPNPNALGRLLEIGQGTITYDDVRKHRVLSLRLSEQRRLRPIEREGRE